MPCTVFYFTPGATLISTILAFAHGLTALNRSSLTLILAMGLSATLGQVLMARAYRDGKTAVVAAVSYSTLPISAAFGYLVFGTTLDALAVLGITSILAAGLLSAYRHTD